MRWTRIDPGGDTTGNGVSELVFTILSAVAEAESDWRREGDELVPAPDQQAAIGRMRKRRAKGLSLRAIRDRLAAEGVSVSHVAVRNALKA